jgi:HAD superfamily hydrolase (TIGR01509 family)
MLKAVLFDLDDTLFDHECCAREALAAVHESHECFRSATFADFERAHAGLLEELHVQVLAGELDLDAARVERFRRLIERTAAADCSPADAARVYRACYSRARRAISGAQPLLVALRPRVRIGIVSNNVLVEQREKMRLCGLDTLVDALVVSEEAGVSKPDPEIFRVALQRLNAAPDQSVMIGDSWTSDVAGARAAGIPAVWFNRAGRPSPDPDAGVYELRALEPIADAIELITLAHATASAHRY